jgi:hypothetical protein
VHDSVTGERVSYVYDSTHYNLVQQVTRIGTTTSTTVNTLRADGKVWQAAASTATHLLRSSTTRAVG